MFMKKFFVLGLLSLLGVGFAQISAADTVCTNSQYRVALRANESSGLCGFDVSGPQLNLGYWGTVQQSESDFTCKGTAYTFGRYQHATVSIDGDIATLRFSNGAPIYLNCP